MVGDDPLLEFSPAQTGVLRNVPSGGVVTAADRELALTYARLRDARRDGTPWAEAARAILGLDVGANPAAAEALWTAFLARADWVFTAGARTVG